MLAERAPRDLESAANKRGANSKTEHRKRDPQWEPEYDPLNSVGNPPKLCGYFTNKHIQPRMFCDQLKISHSAHLALVSSNDKIKPASVNGLQAFKTRLPG